MNLFQLQERLKNYSQDQLVNEMKNPTGSAPQYLILSELQRRKRMMTEEQAQMPQEPSVAEEAVAAAGVPQGGLAQMAQAMAPETDVVQNTARMFGGGNVGARGGEPDRGSISLPQGTTGQNIVDFIKKDPQAVLKAGTSSAADPFSGILEFIQTGLSEETKPQASGPSQQAYTPPPAGYRPGVDPEWMYSRMTPRGMAEGGEVRRMSEGGLSGVSPRLTDFMPIGPSSRRASGRGIAITPMQMGQSIYEDYIEEMRRLERERRGSPEGLDLGMTADEVNRRANQGRYDPADASPPTVGAREIAALAGEEPIDLRGEVEFPTIGAGLTSLMNQAPSRELDSVIDGLVGSGVESRFDPTDELRTYMSPAERSRMMLSDPDIIERAAALDLTPEQYISSLSPARQDAALQAAVNRAAASMPAPRSAEDRMMFGETPIGAIQSERTEEPMDETLRRILANSEAAIARDTAAVPAFADRRAPDFVTAMPPEALPSIPEDINRARFADIPVGALPSDGRMRFGQTPVGDLRPERNVMRDNELANLELQGFDDTDQSGASGYGFADMGEDIMGALGGAARGVFGDEAIDEIIRNREIGRERERTRELAGQFEAEAEAADAETAALDRAILADQFEAEGEVADAEARLPVVDLVAQREGAGGGSGGGGAGGTGGGAAAAQASSDDLYEQDKWLALAQFGLGLMSSQAPTLGQAIGEAGATGIAALRQAREDRQDRIEASQARADRLAAAAARAQREDSPEFDRYRAEFFAERASGLRERADAIRDDGVGGTLDIEDLSEAQREQYNALMENALNLESLAIGLGLSGVPGASEAFGG